MDYNNFFSVSIIKTIYFNFKYLPFNRAIKFPILIAKKVYLKSAKGRIKITQTLSFGMIKIGFGNVGIFDKKVARTIWENFGEVVFYGRAKLGHGTKISVGELGFLSMGDNVIITAETSIAAHHRIVIGNDCLFSWDTLIMDTDFHKILNEFDEQINKPAPIVIGNSVWVGCRCLILKGSSIPNNTIIGANTIVNKKLHDENSLYAGNPVVKLKNNIKWEI